MCSCYAIFIFLLAISYKVSNSLFLNYPDIWSLRTRTPFSTFKIQELFNGGKNHNFTAHNGKAATSCSVMHTNTASPDGADTETLKKAFDPDALPGKIFY